MADKENSSRELDVRFDWFELNGGCFHWLELAVNVYFTAIHFLQFTG